MSAKQTPMLLGRFVEHQDRFNSLPTDDAQWAIQNPKDAATLCVAAIKSRTNGTPKPERTYKVLRPATPEIVEPRPFKADDTFFNKNSDLKMVPHGDNFTKWFAGKVEDDVPDGELRVFALAQAAYDRDIIADLGGEEKAEITLGELWRFMRKHDRSASGWFLCYIRDNSGVLRTVYVDRNVDGWDACAYALGDYRWDDDRQVLSRNS